MIYVKDNKTILTDCDGVLLDWEYAYDGWMSRHGYDVKVPGVYKMDEKYGLSRAEGKKLCRMFNESANIRRIPPMRDAIKYVKKLHEEHGYVFHVITSLSDDEYAQHLRTKNLRETFGDTVFERYVYLDTGADKDEVLKEYQNSGCLWVEDKPHNAELGYSFGLDAVLFEHEHSKDYEGVVSKVTSWKEIYEKITGI
jgi:beta-phosphoglucomutase-like phosphatase (HAD superfamily)